MGITETAKYRLVQPIATRISSKARRRVFEDIYREHRWGGSESRSGPGSTLDRTEDLVEALPGMLAELGVKTLLDVPCGDWGWMRHVNLDGINYIGADIVPKMIEELERTYGSPTTLFLCLDAVSEPLPPGDAVLARTFFIHLPNAQIWKVLRNFKATGARWLLASTVPDVTENVDIRAAGNFRPLNLRLPPFSFPEPVAAIRETQQERDLAAFDLTLIDP